MTNPLAAFFTWTTYGTWLPGDPRGYVSNTLKPNGGYKRRQNVPGTPFTSDDRYTRTTAQKQMKFDPVILTPVTEHWAAEGLIDAARDYHWRILRGAIMATHTHVLMPLADDKAWVRKILKGRASRRMSEQQGMTWRWWAAGGRDDHLFTDESVTSAANYIENQEGILAFIADNTLTDPPTRRSAK